MKKYPGSKSKPFIIKLEEDWFKKGDILETSDESKLKIIKIYKFNWWRRLLFWFGFPFKYAQCIKVLTQLNN